VDEYKAFKPPSAPLADTRAAGMTLADRGTRLAAVILDGIIVGAVTFIAGLLVLWKVPREGQTGSGFGAICFLCAGGVLSFLAWNAVWVHIYGQTIGKRITRIRVVRANGSRAGLLRIFFLRYLPLTIVGILPLVGPIVGLLDALLIFRDSCQCLHDQIADTLVILA